MKVVMVAHSLSRSYGGPTESLVGYASGLLMAGVERLAIVGPTPSARDQEWLHDQLPGAEIRTFPTIGRGAFTFSPALHRWLRARAGSFDIVHVAGLLNPISSCAARSCLRRGRAVVIRPYGTLSRYTMAHRRGWLKRPYFAALDAPNLRRAAAIHFTTRQERDEARWHGIQLEERSWVVPPPLRTSTIQPSATAPSGPPVALFLSRLHPVKNVELLLRAWALAVTRVPDARLVIAGDGEPGYVASLRRLAVDLGLADSVEFAGFVTGARKEELLDQARLFVLPSQHENFGMSVLEAAGKGVAVVVTPDVQLSEFIQRHRLGKVVPAERRALSKAIVEVATDGALQRHCRRAGPRAVSSTFSELGVGRKLLERFHLIHGGAPSSDHPPRTHSKL